MRKIPSALLFALPALVAPAALAGTLDDARAARDAGDWEKARALYEKALAETPTDAVAALGLVETLAGLGRFEDAGRAARAGLEHHPDDVALHIARARAFLSWADQLDAAQSDSQQILATVAEADLSLKAALALDAKSADGRVLKAKVIRFQGGSQSPSSKALLEEVLAEFPRHFDAHWDLAKIAMQGGALVQKDANAAAPFWGEAVKHFHACTEIDPKSGDAYQELGNALAWERASAESVVSAYEKAALLLAAPSDRLLGNLYRWSGRDKAGRVKRFERVAEAHPEDPNVALYLGFAQHEAGDTEQGLRTMEAAEKLHPEAALLPFNRGQILIGQGKTDAAFAAFRAAVAASGAFVKTIYDTVGTRALQYEGFTPAQREALWTAVWEKWPDVVDVPNNAGLWYRDQAKDYTKSAVWYERAAKAAPDSPQVLNDTALVLDQYLNRFDDAVPYYERAIAAGEDQRRDWRGGDIEDTGYRDCLNNYGRMLAGLKRWDALRSFCEQHLPEEHPLRAGWLRAAENGGK